MLMRYFLCLLYCASLYGEQRLALGLSANGVSSAAVYPGAPLILTARLFSASGEPILLEASEGTWTAALSLRISAPDGSSLDWYFKTDPSPEAKVTLDDKQSVQLYWLLSPEDAAAVGPGSFEITLVADATELASAGAWNGRESSNTVQVSFKPEPDDWTAEQLNQHWLSLSLYHQLNGDNAASLEAVENLLAKQPESVPAWTRKGEVQAASDLADDAVASFQKALDIFYKSDPKPTHPPSEILGKLNELELRLLTAPVP